MPFSIDLAPTALAQYNLLKAKAEAVGGGRKGGGAKKSSKDEGLFKQVAKALQFLQENPRHPGLNTHEFDSLEHPFDKKKKVLESYVQNKTPGAYRVFWCYGPGKDVITVIAITPHP